MATAYLGLGSNLGDRLALLREARRALGLTQGLRVSASSPLYETEPVGDPPGQGLYLNAVLEVEADFPPRRLLETALALETRLGRRRETPGGARTLDIDLLLFDDDILEEPGLILPHPRLHLRRFVLAPLCDLAPHLPHPVLGHTLGELLEVLVDPASVTLFLASW